MKPARAFGSLAAAPDPAERALPQQARCKACGDYVSFGTNGMGLLVEHCTRCEAERRRAAIRQRAQAAPARRDELVPADPDVFRRAVLANDGCCPYCTSKLHLCVRGCGRQVHGKGSQVCGVCRLEPKPSKALKARLCARGCGTVVEKLKRICESCLGRKRQRSRSVRVTAVCASCTEPKPYQGFGRPPHLCVHGLIPGSASGRGAVHG